MARTLNFVPDAVPGGSRRLPLLRGSWAPVLAGVLGLAGGGLSALGRPDLSAILLALIVAALVMTSRVAVFWFIFVVALVVTGLAMLYLPGSRYVRYVVPIASLAFVLHWLSDYFETRDVRRDDPIPGPMSWAYLFLLLCVGSTLMNLSDPTVALVGAKNYFQMWVFFLGLVYLAWPPSLPRRMLWAMVAVGLVQLPFVAHEYLFLMPQRVGLGEGIVPADVIAGTFGATLLGGGANAVLAAFQIVVVTLLAAQWKNGLLAGWKLAVLAPVLLSPLLVNQAKVSALYLPLAFVVLFRRDIVVRPLKFLGAAVGVGGAFAVLMTALVLTSTSGKVHSWSDLVDDIVAKQTETVQDRQGPYSELTRWTALTFWAKEHLHRNPAYAVLGHGVGASRESEGGLDIANTLAETRYRGLHIGLTAVSSLLWDTGLLGLGAVLAMFASAFFMAGRLARYYRGRDGFRSALFEGIQASLAVLGLSLAHKDFFVVHIPYQAFVYLIIGYVCHAWLVVVRARVPVVEQERL